LDFLRKRIIISVLVFIVAINLDFVLPRLIPGNAAEIFASGSKLPAQEVILLEQRFGLNQPVYVQYYLFLKGIFLNWPPFFGVSYTYYPVTVSDLIIQRLPWSILLVVSSLLLSFQISYILAATSSLRRGGKFEFGSLYGSIVFWSTPAFWIGMILIWIFSVYLGWLPVFGTFGFNAGSGLDFARSVILHAILPIVTLTAVVFGQNYFILRAAAQDALKSDYVLTAKSRGIKESTIAFGYVMRNSLLPSVSLLGYALASLISAVVLVEAVFGYTGVGDLIVDAILNRDYPVLEGTFFYMTVIVIAGGLLGDFVLTRLDPRLRR
jgi:peptide/nickel transport system permease protein